MLITKTFEFEAAHRLPDHEGACARLHGHTYRLEVTINGPLRFDSASDYGFVMDFKKLSEIVKDVIIRRCDHQLLNDVLKFRPTAELMAVYFFGLIEHELSDGIEVDKISLWETSTSFATCPYHEFDEELWQKLDCPV